MSPFKSNRKVSANFKEQLFNFCRRFDHVAWLDSHPAKGDHEGYDLIVALASQSNIQLLGNKLSPKDLSHLGEFLDGDYWKFGFISYDLKNAFFEGLESNNEDRVAFPLAYFFQPEILITVNGNELEISGGSEDQHRNILALENTNETRSNRLEIDFEVRAVLSKELYIQKVNGIKEHIRRGNVYEVNFCHEYYAEEVQVDPYDLHLQLMQNSPSPFSSFVRCNDHYVLCASPERYIKKEGSHLISQPIKGTIKRGADKIEDEQLKQQLKGSKKDQAENVMIVDLVRNDLSRVAEDGSVKVEELFGIYSFAQVHQMISTISCEVKDKSLLEVLAKSFPMGSMTGAPKKRAMEIIEQFEASRRGVYSGSIGYVDPNGDFDFNVVIRSILYNAQQEVLSFSVGGAITHYCDAEQEYDESLLKAKGILSVLNS